MFLPLKKVRQKKKENVNKVIMDIKTQKEVLRAEVEDEIEVIGSSIDVYTCY